MSPVHGPRTHSQIQRGIQNHKDAEDNLKDRGIKHYKVSGRIQVIGNGETSATITFPVSFLDRPQFSWGWEVAHNQTLVTGQIPTLNVGLYRWTTVNSAIAGVPHYTGAVLTVVTTNNPQYVWVQWHMDGRAFKDPS